MKFFEETIERKEIYSGRILSLHVDQVKLPDGQTSFREIVDHKNAVAVLAIDNGNIIFVKQFRKAVEKMMMEIPAGLIEEGELPEEAAARELQEEIGLKPQRMIFLGKMLLSPGFTNETTMLFFADDFEQSRLEPDDDEFVQTVKIPVETAGMLFRRGKFSDAKTACALGRFFSMNHSLF